MERTSLAAQAVGDVVRDLLPELGAVGDATPVPKGHGHECWRVATERGPVMVKLALRGTTSLSMENLAEALRLAGLGRVPAPRLVWSGHAPAALGERPMLIQEFLEGADGEEALGQLAPDARRRYFREWGRAVGRLHSVEPSCFSNSLSEAASCRATWAEVAAERLERMMFLNRQAGVISDPALEQGAARIAEGARRVSPAVRPALVHGDLYPPNTLLRDGRLVAILDFEHAKAWDPVHDFVKLRMWTFEVQDGSEAPFLDGYRATAPVADLFEQRLQVCLGLELLAGFPYWRKHGEEAMLADYLARFERWLAAEGAD